MPIDIDAPIVVVGMGGSGTRIVARILREAGVYMGLNTNGVKEDALAFAEFDYRWVPPFLASRRSGSDLPNGNLMSAKHEECVAAHLSGAGDEAAWGWKHCPSGHLLPFLAVRHPNLRIVHVIRDGRDMAFGESGGRTHTLRLGRAVIDGDSEPVLPGDVSWRGRSPTLEGSEEATPARQAMFWALTNEEIAECGEWRSAKSVYLRVCFEALVSEPGPEAHRILERLELPQLDGTPKLDDIQIPPTTGRWRDQPADIVQQVIRSTQDQLTRFGYVDS